MSAGATVERGALEEGSPTVRVSARAVNTLMSVNVSVRITSRRKTLFLLLDSIRVSARAGAHEYIDIYRSIAPLECPR